MGCCQSEPSENEYEPNERDPLMVSGRGSLDSSGHGQLPGDSSGGQQRSDEQSALTRILQETSNNLIDISAQSLAADVTEETEATFKSKQYSSRINAVRVPLDHKLGHGAGRPKPLSILAEPPIPLSDLDLVIQAAQRTPHCMKLVTVHHKEDLIVQFGVP